MAPSRLPLVSVAIAALAAPAWAAASYVLEETYDHTNFFDKFAFVTDADPSHGYVTYVGKDEVADRNLAFITPDKALRLAVDASTPLVFPTDAGRRSVRLEGVESFNKGLFVADFAHLPTPACGAWPAFWMYGPNWPHSGELDIYEAWNLQEYNTISVHTSGDYACTLPPSDADLFTGAVLTADCNNTYHNEPLQYPGQGCGTAENGAGASDSPFASPDGGIYAAEWTDDAVKVWSWPHGTPSLPADLLLLGADAAASPDPSGWGTPRSYVGTPGCDLSKNLVDQHLVLNIDFCGDAAGNNFGQCAAAFPAYASSPVGCAAYVADHPAAFAGTYFDLTSIRIFQRKTLPSPLPSASVPSSAGVSASGGSVSSSSAPSSAPKPDCESPSSVPASASISQSSGVSPPSSVSASAGVSPSDSVSPSVSVSQSSRVSPPGSISVSPCPSGPPSVSASPSVSSSSSVSPSGSVSSSASPSGSASSSGSTAASGSAWSSVSASSVPASSVPASSPPVSTSANKPTSSSPSSGSLSVGPFSTSASAGVPSSGSPASGASGYSTETRHLTTTSTILSCAPTATNCPYGQVTTVVYAVTTAVCPVSETEKAGTSAATSATPSGSGSGPPSSHGSGGPNPAPSTGHGNGTTAISVASSPSSGLGPGAGSGGGVSRGPISPGSASTTRAVPSSTPSSGFSSPGSGGGSGPGPGIPVVTAGSSKAGVRSLAFAAVALYALLL